MKTVHVPALVALLGAGVLATTSATTGRATRQNGDKGAAQYVGAKACRKCHRDQYKSWKKTKMAQVFEQLKPGVSAAKKKEHGLDPDKDYRRDPTCLACHTTGFGKPGGYAIPPEGDSPEARKARKHAAAREGVQCEACHGPASLVIEFKKRHEEYAWKELAAEGLRSGVVFPTKETCLACHNEKSPFVGDGYVFDYDKRRLEGTHRHYRMDFDHGCPHRHSVTKKKRKKKKK